MPQPTEMWSDSARGSGSNGTVWQQYVDVTFLVANCIILLGTSLVGIGANVFVAWAVYHQKSLQTWNNALLVNLAVIDLLRCAVDCPIILVIVLTVHRWGQADGVICNLQMASFCFSCCIQLVTLACISAERYQAIAHPFKITERKRRIIIFIPLTWTFAILVAAVCVTFVKDSPMYVKCHGSRFRSTYRYDTFGLYILIPLWTACFVLIIGFYARIFAIVTAHSRKIFDKGVNPVPKVDIKENVAEAKKANEMPESQPDKKQMTAESVAQAEKVDRSKSNVSNVDSAGAAQKPTETVSVPKAPHHNEKAAKPTTDTDKPPDENLQEQPKKLTPKKAKGDSVVCKTTPKVQVVEVSSKMEKTTPVAHPVIEVQAVLSIREIEGQNGGDRVPGKGQDKIQIKESKSPEAVTVALKAPVLPSPCASPSKDPGGPDKPVVLPLLTDLDQEKKNADGAVALAAADAGDNNMDLCVVPLAKRQAPEEITGAVCMMPSKANKDRGNKKKESKLAKRSGYIILTFLLFWLPLITTILVDVLMWSHSSRSETRIVQDVEILFISIACMTSLSDPIIYAAVNPQFRTEFYRLRNKLKALWKKR